MTGTTVMRAANFLGTLGVNTHLPYTDGGYANLSNVESDLAYLGISKVRDTLSNGYAGSAPLSTYVSLAQRGITFDVLLFVGGNQTTASVATSLVLAQALDKAVPGSVSAVEGANEVNNFTLTYNGVGGINGAVALQKAIYATVKADALLPGVSVYYFTGYNAGSIGVGPNPATTPGLADADTQHPYPNNGQAPLAWVNRTQALGNETPATGPAVYTETGYSTNGGTSGAVNQDVQAKYTLDLLMDDAKDGISTTYLYQLMDAYAQGSPQGDDGFGLFGTSNQPKEAATAIHDLTTILADSGSKAATFTLAPLTYTLTHLPATGSSLELQKSSGATDIVVWNEPQIWNEAAGKEVTAATVQTTVTLGATYATVKVFDPLVSASAIETLHNVSSLTLALTDHPLIVEVEPQASTVSGGTGTSTTGTTKSGTTTSGTSTTATITSASTSAASGSSGADTVAAAGSVPVVTAASVTAVTTTSAQGASVPAFTFPGATVAAGALAQSQYAVLFQARTVSFAGSGAIPAPVSAQAGLVLTGGSTATLPAGYAAVLDDATGDRLSATGGISAFLQNNTYFSAGTGNSTVYAAGSDTISAGSGALTVLGGAGRLAVTGGSGALSVIGGSGSVSVTGGSGSAVLIGSTGAGSTVLQGGSGNNTLTGGSGSGASTLIGGNNVTEFAAGSGPTMMVAGTGTSIMNGTTGTGAETVFTAGGQALIALNAAADTLVGGSGASTVVGGGGATIFAFLNGHAGGSEEILGFSAHDNLAFGGFAGWAITSETVVGGSDVMRLTDGTEITFLGLAHTLF